MNTRTQMNTAGHNAIDSARQLSDQVLQSASDAIDSSSDRAVEALDSADRKLRGLRSRIDPAIDEWAATAQRVARRGLDLAAETRERAQQSLTRAADVTERYVAEQPVKAVLIAAAAGALIAALSLSAARKRRSGMVR